MFQSYNNIYDSAQSTERINLLRETLIQHQLDGYIVPLSDEYQGEYIAPYAQRLQWLTGFRGSAGMALILKDSAIFFTDGRYTLQVQQQTDNNIFNYLNSAVTPISQYLKENNPNLTIGIDPALFTIAQANALKNSCNLVYPTKNLVDTIWCDQPAPPANLIWVHDIKYSGKESSQKIIEIQNILIKNNCDNLILSDATSIAWLFNIRGNDIPHNPVALAFACISATKKPVLFINLKKISEQVANYLKTICEVKPQEQFLQFIDDLAKKGHNFGLDELTVTEQIHEILMQNKANIKYIKDPIILAKAIKNETELEGARKAHILDGVAMVRFLSWIDKQAVNTIDEIAASKKLEEYRINTAKDFNTELKDISFDSISGAGEHGAIIHYRVTEETNKILKNGELYLIDSGGQYLSGTTDITRTVAIGTIGTEEKKCFTLVLKGMINLSIAKFLPGTKGSYLDILARNALLQHGLDYAHGTGHGVGSYLSVHEGPQSISRLSEQVLFENMIVSNEPGYYKNGKFGIRIENLIIVNKAEQKENQDIATHSFETLTCCPIDIRLIDKTLLNDTEIEWLNNYHAMVYEKLSSYLDEATKLWLKAATEAI